MRGTLEYGLIAAIAVSVGGFGGTQPVLWGLTQSLVLLLGLILILNPARFAFPFVSLAHWIVPALLGWVVIQWGASKFGKIGFDPQALKSEGLLLLALISAFYVAAEVARYSDGGVRLAVALICIGVFESFYGLVQYLTGWQYIWNVRRRFYLGSATGTYINHNHFAGLLEMILPIILCLAIYHLQNVSRTFRYHSAGRVSKLGHPSAMKAMLLILAAAAIVLAILFSLSRMGMISMLASIAVVAGASAAGKLRTRWPIVLVALVVLVGFGLSAWVGAGPIIEHFGQLRQNETFAENSEGRFALGKDTLQLIRANPWTGVGLGCFAYAFTKFQTIRLTYIADHAHNDYLELTSELGIPAASILFVTIFCLIGTTFVTSVRNASSLSRSLALGSCCGAFALLIHGIADFNLYIPANALVFAVLLGIGCGTSREKPSSITSRTHNNVDVPLVAADAR